MSDVFASAMVEYGKTPADVAAAVGVTPEAVRRWMDDTRPRPGHALGVARLFPIATGTRILERWGYSPKPLTTPPKRREAPDPTMTLAKAVDRLTRTVAVLSANVADLAAARRDDNDERTEEE